MPVQSLLWTALPNGLADARSLRLSVLLSPRLDPQDAAPRLDTFGDFRVWPDTLRDARFTIRLGARAVTLGTGDADGTLGLPDAAAWQALLPPDTPVQAFAFKDYADHTVLSYDVGAVHDLLRQVYARLATDGDELPTLDSLLADSGLGALVKGVAELDGRFASKTGHRAVGRAFEEYARDPRAPFKFLKADALRALAAAQLFHTPPSTPELQGHTAEQVPDPRDPRRNARWTTYRRTPLPTAAELVKSFDFHRLVSAMNQYPRLLRRLGLVVDFVVPRTAFAAGGDQPLTVEVALAGTGPAGRGRRAASPRTRTRLTATAFEPVPRPSPAAEDLRVQGGLLRLDDERFALVQADVDGAALKLLNFARSLRRHVPAARRVDPVTLHARGAGAPALRTAGLQLVQRGRGAMLANAFQRNRTLEQAMRRQFDRIPGAVPPDLWAEDLVRGWRLDVLDRTTGRWRSVCERVADYRLDGGAVALTGVREEGTVRLAATTSPDPDANQNVVWLHETLTAWAGWSLVARPPGRTIATDDATPDPAVPPVRDGAPDVPPGVRLRTSFAAAPGSLPRLRYGRAYTMRARAVDLAGNSLPPRETDYANESTVFTGGVFRRFEPVQAPALALVRAGATLHAPAAGESMERLAIRTANDVFDDPAPTTAVARRWAVPPRVSVREAELHGALDSGGRVDPARYAMLVARDAELAAEALTIPAPLADAATPVTPATYAVLDEGAPLPYLPDPLCTRVAARLFGLRSIASETIIEIPLYPPGRTWPDAAPFQVHLYESATDAPRFEESTRTLRVPLRKAARATLRLSAMFPKEALDQLGVWSWLPPAAQASLERRALGGQLWLLTPWRRLELVHAVQRPLVAPVLTFEREVLSRASDATPDGLGETSARVAFRARCGLSSTARVDLQAAWHEPRDAGGTAPPASLARTDHAFSVKITAPRDYAALGGGPGTDTPPVPGAPEHAITGIDEIGVALGGATAGGIVPHARRVHDRRHEFGDTRYRRVEYRLEATSRFREFMPSEVLTEPEPNDTRRATDARITVAGPVARAWVPSSAPPPAPEVLYVMPTFGWSRGEGAQGARTSWRRGGGLRIYLDRPWCASGFGEMLAVVLLPATSAAEPNDPPYKHVVTQWGADPTWRAPLPDGIGPAQADFPLARLGRDPSGAWLPPFAPPTEADQPPEPFPTRGLPHPSVPPGGVLAPVDIAPHDVQWDPERRLWYCDVELAFGRAYFPFVRLALARYQPVSLPGTHLSPIVLADFAQLAPHRGVSVAGTSVARQRQVRVFGFAPEESAGHREAFDARVPMPDPAAPGRTRLVMPSGIAKDPVVEVWVETLDPGASEDFGWRRDDDAAVSPARPTIGSGRSAVPDAARVRRARDLHTRRDFATLTREGLVELVADWQTLWSGTVTLAAGAPTGRRHRLVVAEYEEHLVDDELPYDAVPSSKGRRLVFVEHVELA